MKTFYNILKILAALAAIAAAVYVAITYGDKIVAWFKGLINKLPCRCCCEEAPVAEEVPAEEAPVEAEEADFEG